MSPLVVVVPRGCLGVLMLTDSHPALRCFNDFVSKKVHWWSVPRWACGHDCQPRFGLHSYREPS